MSPRARLRNLVNHFHGRQGAFFVGAGITFVFNALAVVFYGAGNIVLARLLGPTEIGRLTWFLSGTATIAMTADIIGVYYSNVYLIARGDAKELPVVRSTVLLYGAIVGLIAAGLFGLLPLGREVAFHGFVGERWGALIAANIAGTVLFYQVRGVLWGQRNFITMGLLTLVKSGVYAILAALLAWNFHWSSAVQVAWVQIAVSWVCVAVYVLMSVADGLGRPDFRYVTQCLRIGWRAAMINWLSFLHQRVDQYLVNVILGP